MWRADTEDWVVAHMSGYSESMVSDDVSTSSAKGHGVSVNTRIVIFAKTKRGPMHDRPVKLIASSIAHELFSLCKQELQFH